MPCYCYCNQLGVVPSQQEASDLLGRQTDSDILGGSRSRSRRAPSIASTSSWRSILSFRSRRTELPPPYENASVFGTSRRKTKLPHAVPLMGGSEDNLLFLILARVHGTDLSEHGIAKEQFVKFYYDLEALLGGGPRPASTGPFKNVLAVLHSGEIRSDETVTDLESLHEEDFDSLEGFLARSNQELFNPVSLQVEVLGSSRVRHAPISSPHLDVYRAMTMTKLSKVEEQLARLTYALDRELSGLGPGDTADREEINSSAQRKRDKLRRKAQEALADYNVKSDPVIKASSPIFGGQDNEGALWLIVYPKPA